VLQAPPAQLGVEHEFASELARGASVAVNGVCLTVLDTGDRAFFADVVPQTLSLTNLGRLTAGQGVNLELPLRADDRLDGHLVQGHVDVCSTVRCVTPVELGRMVEFDLPPAVAHLVAEKGSIAIDGVSLTVAALDRARGTFSVAFIPHTLASTVAGEYEAGSVVNLEADVVARYLARLIEHRGG